MQSNSFLEPGNPALMLLARMREPNAGRKLLNYAAYVVLAYLGYQLSGYLYYGGKLLWVSSGPEPDPGTPPFHVRFEREMTASKKVAMMDFPDPASCLTRLKWMTCRQIA